jgi:hypothetical protein
MKMFLGRLFNTRAHQQRIIEDHELSQQCLSADIWEDIHDSAHVAAQLADDLGRSRKGDPRLLSLIIEMDHTLTQLTNSYEHYKLLHVR